ncbi:hypothetical protein [uncultured Rothia sp.]|uniref:hypothetical protein n=1 Tax=uncultured Rothia sp. TaxID=316088 RepID=UPI00288965D3|nr:hypothetical protein [uncultured Rothia sp.]
MLIGSSHPSTPYASAILRNIACSSARAHLLPALLIPEDYRACAVALHARELILRSPQMSAIALGGFSGGFTGVLNGGFSTGVENAGERLPNDGLDDIVDLLRKMELTGEQKLEIYFLIKKYLGSVQ